MERRSFLRPPSFEGGDVSPLPSSPSTTESNSATPEKDFDAEVNKLFHFGSATSSPMGKAPPNSALTTPDVITPSAVSSTEPSPPGSSHGHPYGYGEREGDFWSSIQKHYDELMDDGLIEKCKDVESDFSLDDESDSPATSSVSFTEFLEQYKELSDWLLHLKRATVQTVHSQSEKYLNQSYQEEMMQRSPRRKLFKEYARRLQRRFPHLKEDICSRLAHLNRQWKELETQIVDGVGEEKYDGRLELPLVDGAIRSPNMDFSDRSFLSMSADLEADLDMLRNWLASVENRLGPLTMRKVQEMNDLEEKLREYQSIQREIESQARVISAVFKLCDRLDFHPDTEEEMASFSFDDDDLADILPQTVVRKKKKMTPTTSMYRDERRNALRTQAGVMQNRWHKVWLLALEWQCCLEERLSQRVVRDFSLSPYLNKAGSLPPSSPSGKVGGRKESASLDSAATKKGADSLDTDDPSLDAHADASGPSFPATASVAIGTENVCKCGFMGDNVHADNGLGGAAELGNSENEPVLCSRCKRPTKDSLDAAIVERDAELNENDDRAIQELVRLFDNTGTNYVDALLHKQRRAQQRLAEPHDIGYSSEGLSNDEDNSVFSPRILAPRDTGLETLSEAPKYEQDAPGNEAKFFPPAALEVFHVVQNEDPGPLASTPAENGSDAFQRLKTKYGLGGVFDAGADESSDLSSTGDRFRASGGGRQSRDSLGSLSADWDQTETDLLDKTPPRHRKSLVRRDSIQKLVMEVEDLIAHERDRRGYDDANGGDENYDDSTLTRKSRRKRAFASEEASAEYTTTTEQDCAIDTFGEGGHSQKEENGPFTSDGDPRSVTEMYEQSLGVDLSPFAIDDGDVSEDAVDGFCSTANIFGAHTFPRTSRSNLSTSGFHTFPRGFDQSRNDRTPPKRIDVAMQPETEEFYISDQVWEYDDFGRDESRKLSRHATTFVPNDEDDDDVGDDYRFRPTSTDDPEDEDDDASRSFTPPSAPSPNFPLKALASSASRRRHNDGDEDSDSDCEELRHVLEESRAQLQVTDVTLGKIKREMIEKGNFLEPSKYKELLATCQTNIKCLQVIHQHLKKPNQSSIPDDVGEIEDIIERWEVLQAVTADKQSRCRVLKELSARLMNAVEFRDEAVAALSAHCRVDGATQLDGFVFDLRNWFFGIAEHKAVLQRTRDGLTEFADSNPRYSVQRIRDSVDAIDEDLSRLGVDFEERIAHLEALYASWIEVGEKTREIGFGIRDLRRPGKILRRAASCAKMSCGESNVAATTRMTATSEELHSQSEVNGIEEDERILKKRARMLVEEIDSVEWSSRVICEVASDDAVEKLTSRFVDLRREIEALTATRWFVEENDVDGIESSEVSEAEVEPPLPGLPKDEVVGEVGFFFSRAMRSAKFVLASFLVVTLLLGLALVVSPDCCFTRNNLKWSLQPQLRYSDGPPPQ